MTRSPAPGIQDWEQFVLAYGWRALAYEMAAVLGQDVKEVERVRRTGACKRLAKGKDFSELFSLWHGRPPEDEDWPLPRKFASRGSYEWQSREIMLLASLVGSLSVPEITQVLTNRLRKLTGDRKAVRTNTAIQNSITRIGMQTNDVVGGITTAKAGREIGSRATINQAISRKQLRARRVGRLWVIPHDAWKEWKEKRIFPPKGHVQLSTIRELLAIRSDKLSEFARMGYIPTAIRCNPYGTQARTTQFGTWYIDKKVAQKLLADRRAGRPMPWHGMPMLDNLKATFKIWKERKHPASCTTCADIWGKNGPPQSFEEYMKRYPPLAHGAKRHLTLKWSPGMTIPKVAEYAGCPVVRVRRAISNGMLGVTFDGKRQYVSRTDATRWKARKCPAGDGGKSWISLDTACKQYLFTLRELRSFIASKKLKSKIGTDGPMRGVEYVSRHQCGHLREKIGFTEEQAARRVKVTVPRLRLLMEGVAWRKANGIPLVTVQAIIKRLESREGHTVEEAALEIGASVQWVHDRIRDGTIRVLQAKWDRRRVYISEPMMQRLRKAKRNPPKKERLNDDWLRLSDAAHEAGVCTTMLIRWAGNSELERRKSKIGWRYHREAVRARARTYWRNIRFIRATPPDWLIAENRA